MALNVTLDVNGRYIGRVSIRRTRRGRNGGLPEPDEVHSYEVKGMINNIPQDSTVEAHRYGDGAAVLVSKALAALHDGKPVLISNDSDEEQL